MPNGAIAHACLVPQGNVGTRDAGEKRFFDEATRLMIVAKERKVEGYDLSNGKEYGPDSTRLLWEMRLDDAHKAKLICISPNQKVLALQRDEKSIEFLDRETGSVFMQGCSKPKKEILGFFFVECQECNVVMVTNTGLELYKLKENNSGLKLRDKYKIAIRWYIYTYGTRVVSLGSGKTGARLVGYQFTSAEIIKLPQVDFDAAPFPVTPEDLMNASMTGSKQPPPLVTEDDVVLLRLYNRVFIGHIDRSRMRLRFYRVFMDIITLVHEYELFSPLLAFSVVDNVILLHQRQASVAVLLDVASEASEPVGSPLPLASKLPAAADGAEGSSQSSGMDIRKFSSRWEFFLPDIVVDETGRVFKVELDLSAVVASYTDTGPLVGFLNRRRQTSAPEGSPKTLLIESLQSILKKGASKEELRTVYNILTLNGSEDILPGRSETSAPSSLKLQSPLLPSQEICQNVFAHVLDSGEVKPSYIEVAVLEYMDVIEKKKIPIPITAYIVLTDALLQQGKVFQLQQLLAGSTEMQNLFIAEHLESHIEGPNSEIVKKLCLDIYSRCGVQDRLKGNRAGCELYCNKLLKEGEVIKALRVAEHHQITSLSASTFLEAARKTGDGHIMRAVGRLCNRPGGMEESSAS
ncbi:hypothetical protein BSKO_01560 [Bryopsis sp. KO-2023]|nr:hypothetical protein BSKO_01560 [Bryopsis sp. KO-2023]